ncbi:hypothetical protein [Pseudomonas sp. IPO3774]|uniref:hypothetical protein n=1 Tax=Pseudomonas sp. IPO3774 TaxID=2738826 RepID=UPI00159FA9BD|nr:hypothetical protein [Pseudomonas sp. IPO3774]NWD64436.1 hypothetical protein [Pseudomonas sp. IPO3774]
MTQIGRKLFRVKPGRKLDGKVAFRKQVLEFHRVPSLASFEENILLWKAKRRHSTVLPCQNYRFFGKAMAMGKQSLGLN